MISVLPTVNAFLNATSAVLLVWGYLLIRRKRIDTHRKVMQTAFATSCLFLVCYLVYHAQVGSVRFQGSGAHPRHLPHHPGNPHRPCRDRPRPRYHHPAPRPGRQV